MSPWLRERLARLAGQPTVLPATALALRACTVVETTSFVARELAGRGGLFRYTLRHNGISVAVRHGTGDVVTLGEVFHQFDYAPPAEVARVLDGTCLRILDLGANAGFFGAYAAARWPEAVIDGFEPDPANAAVHRRAIALNRLGERWRLTQAAASTKDGTARFASGGVALSALSAEGDIEVDTRDVVPLMSSADLVKIDIEGGEWALLTDARFIEAPPRVLVLEYHPDVGCPGPDPHVAIRSLLARSEMEISEIWQRDGYGMLWAWRA